MGLRGPLWSGRLGLAATLCVAALLVSSCGPTQRARVVLEARDGKIGQTEIEMLKLIEQQRARTSGFGIDSIVAEPDGRVVFQLSLRSTTPEEAGRTLSESGRVEFREVLLDKKKASGTRGAMTLLDKSKTRYLVGPPQLTGEEVADARVQVDPNTKSPVVDVTFNAAGTQRLADLTRRLVGKQLAIVCDGVLLSAPVIQEPILDGKAMVSGPLTEGDASRLATVLRSGSLPVEMDLVEAKSTTP